MSPTTADSNPTSGTAVLATASDDLDDGPPWTLHGTVLPEDALTEGKTGNKRHWPAEVLQAAEGMLDGRPLVKNFHELEGQADADQVIGEVSATEYVDGAGLLWEGETTDREIAEKVAHGFLEVSPVIMIAEEQYDARRDAYVVEEVAGFRDLAVVADGHGGEARLGENPAVAALARAALANGIDATGGEGGDGEGDPEADADGGGDDPGDDGDADTASTPAVGAGVDGGSDGSADGIAPDATGLTALLAEELSITTPDRCRTIKDGAVTIDHESHPVAQDVLGTGGEPVDIESDSVARQALGLDDGDA